MADFGTLESSLQDSNPLEVYKFALGGQSFLYTSAEDEIVLGADTYEPIAISRNEIQQGQDARKRILEVTVPASNAFAQRYVVTPPGQRATLSIIRLQRDEVPTFSTQVLVYKGSVQSAQFPDDGQTAKIAVQSIEAASSRTIPRFTYSGMCNHILYDERCKVDPALFNHIGNVTVESGNDITVTGAGAAGLDFTGGFARPSAVTDFRLIVAQAGDVLTLLIPFEVPVLNTDVQAFAGCDFLIEGDCALVFDQVIEFGGFAHVPSKDIFSEGLD